MTTLGAVWALPFAGTLLSPSGWLFGGVWTSERAIRLAGVDLGGEALLREVGRIAVIPEPAGGDARTLMAGRAGTLAPMSAGAVFMGANTYIGNAPNLMIRAIAEGRGVRMPGFFGYMAWSGMILLPLFAIVALIWFS